MVPRLVVEEGEFWKDIPGYEGKYQASTLGRIKSLTSYNSISKGENRYNHKLTKEKVKEIKTINLEKML